MSEATPNDTASYAVPRVLTIPGKPKEGTAQ